MKGLGILPAITLAVCSVIALTPLNAAVIYVDDDAQGPQDGTSWENAFRFLQDALAVTTAGDEIRVAQGEYKPDQSNDSPLGSGDSQASFHLKNGVSLYGGYAGGSGSNPDRRDVARYISVLSGDIGVPHYIKDNCKTIVMSHRLDASTVLDGFTLTLGGGLYNDEAHPTIMNCNFENNISGGIHNEYSHPAIISCRFKNNDKRVEIAGSHFGSYGGAISNEHSHPIIDQCWFEKNSTEYGGGISFVGQGSDGGIITNSYFVSNGGTMGGSAIHADQCNLVLINCLFNHNVDSLNSDAHSRLTMGGAIHSINGSSLTVKNCTFYGLSARSGGAIYSKGDTDDASHLTLDNCILWGNTASHQGSQIYLTQTDAIISYSIIQGGKAGIGGDGTVWWNPSNLVSDPQFVDPEGPDNTAGTHDDNLRLLPGSPAIDAGDNGVLADLLTTDIAGRPRFIDAPEVVDRGNGKPPIVDLGAYEGAEDRPSLVLNTGVLVLDEDSRAVFTVAMDREPFEPVMVRVLHMFGDRDIRIIEPKDGILWFNVADYAVPQNVIVAARLDDDFLDDEANIQVKAPGYLSGGVTVSARDVTTVPRILYVDKNGQDDFATGRSWPHAINDLQQALTIARQNPEVAEIRVASGVYHPTQINNEGRMYDQETTFLLVNGLALRGGYAGYGTSDPNCRDLQAYETVLSGDIEHNDQRYPDPNVRYWYPESRSDNSYAVVDCHFLARSAILDGFTVCGGHRKQVPRATSGGIRCLYGSSPIVSNCLIRDNRGFFGGGIFIEGNPLIVNTTIRENYASGGGGVYREGGSPVFINCCVSGNQAGRAGALLADSSGFISSMGSRKRIPSGPIELSGCTIVNNRTTSKNSGITLRNSELILRNCILWDNHGPANHRVSIELENRYNSKNNIPRVFLSYSDLELGQVGIRGDDQGVITWGEGNIQRDPLFVYDLGEDSIFNPRANDFHLLSDSPCIDTGSHGINTDTVFLTLIPGIDADLNVRRAHGPNGAAADPGASPNIDMGPYEYGGTPISVTLYVDAGATGTCTGMSWRDAFTDLQTALFTASVSLGKVKEIHVATGTYTPASANSDPNATFQLLINVALYGGFPRGGASIAERDPDGYPTFLSGDLLGNDGVDWVGYDENCTHVVTGSNTDASAVLDGFVICGGHAVAGVGAGLYTEYGSPTLRNCTFQYNKAHEAGSAVGGLHATVTFVDCLIQDNHGIDVYLENSTVSIPDPRSTLILVAGELRGDGLILDGDGTLKLDAASVLDLKDTTVCGHIRGPGLIQVDLDSDLILEARGTVDLGSDDAERGRVVCEGLLHLRGESMLFNANVDVQRATFADDAIMVNCVVNAEAGAPYGQFFIEGNAGLQLDRIWADGDRYLDMDPETYSGNNIQVRAIEVDVTEGVAGTQGGLFELRGLDLNLPGERDDFLCSYRPIPDFDLSTWTLTRLELKPGAKLNLTNRFDFQFPYHEGGAREVLYVKELVLGADAVLNTAFNRVYYEHLSMDPTARIVNVPLLGFSLNNITFDDEHDYLTRVTHNNLQGDVTSERIHVHRIVHQDPDPKGFMQMRNLRDNDPGSPHYSKVVPARAKALFARSSEAEILIRFEYLWRQAPQDAELVIYLTDVPELLRPSDPIRQDHYVEVARLSVPPAGYPGAVGSGEFGVFHRLVSREHLNFVRGTRVEFQLQGASGTCLWIDNWDPGIRCLAHCGDVAGPGSQVNVIDFLAALSECGRSLDEIDTLAGGEGSCLDGFFSTDGIVSHHDALAFDFMSAHASGCLQPMTAAASGLPGSSVSLATLNQTAPALSPSVSWDPHSPGELLILGKCYRVRSHQAHDFLSEGLFTEDSASGQIVAAQSLDSRLNIRLIRDPQGRIHALNLKAGLIRLDEHGSTVVGPRTFARNEGQVYVGYHETPDSCFTAPVWDASFDRTGRLYVVPVTVIPEVGSAYQAAARLIPGSSGNYELEALYPVWVPGVDIQGLRELAVDPEGRLFVSHVDRIRNNDGLWVFDTESGQFLGRLPLNVHEQGMVIAAPGGLHLSPSSETLYLSSGLHAPDARNTTLYGLSVSDILDYLAQDHAELSPVTRELTIQGLGQITDITEDPQTGHLWVIGFTIHDIPPTEVIQSAGVGLQAPFYVPCMAEIPADHNGAPVEARTLSDYSPDVQHDLALPLSILCQN